MCVLLFALNQHSQYPFVMAANRDELYDRPSRAARFWEEFPQLLAGQDLNAYGTWLGVTRSGRFAAVTNHYGAPVADPTKKSRGTLVCDFLTGDQSIEEYSAILMHTADQFNGYGIVFGDTSSVHYQSNQGEVQTRVSSGVHGLGNCFLESNWPRVEEGKRRLTDILNRRSDNLQTEDMFSILSDATPSQTASTGPEAVDLHSMSADQLPLFLRLEKMGTRSSTVVLADRLGHITFEERTFSRDSIDFIDQRKFQFQIQED